MIGVRKKDRWTRDDRSRLPQEFCRQVARERDEKQE